MIGLLKLLFASSMTSRTTIQIALECPSELARTLLNSCSKRRCLKEADFGAVSLSSGGLPIDALLLRVLLLQASLSSHSLKRKSKSTSYIELLSYLNLSRNLVSVFNFECSTSFRRLRTCSKSEVAQLIIFEAEFQCQRFCLNLDICETSSS